MAKSTVSTAPVSPEHLAVLNKYGFGVARDNGNHVVNDDVVAKHYALRDASKKGRYTAKTLDEALAAAVAVRKAYEVEIAKPKATNGAKPKVADKPVDNRNVPVDTGPAKPATKPETAEAAKPAGKVLPANNGKQKPTSRKPEAKPEAKPEPETKPEPEEDDKTPDPVIDDAELDNTGKRERVKKTREPVVRGPRRYLRAARVIVKRLDIGQEALSRQAEMSFATAGFCREAWDDVIEVLLAAKAFNPEWTKKLSPVPVKAKKAEAKKAA